MKWIISLGHRLNVVTSTSGALKHGSKNFHQKALSEGGEYQECVHVHLAKKDRDLNSHEFQTTWIQSCERMYIFFVLRGDLTMNEKDY